MIVATTPILQFTIKSKSGSSVDLTNASHVKVSLVQLGVRIELEEDSLEIEENVVRCYLTQEQSLKFKEGREIEVQINWLYMDANGITRRAATKVKPISADKQLFKQVME